MQVQVIEVSYLREKQPKDYEKVTPQVKFIANVGEDDDYKSVATELMLEAASAVHAGMGLSLPATIANKLGGKAEKEEKPKKTQTASKKESKPKEETRQVTETPEDRVNPEDDAPPKDEAASDDEMPDGMDHTQLHAFMLSLVTGKATSNKKKLAPETAKAVFAGYDVERVSDLDDDKIPEVWAKFNTLRRN